jgi:hypothetical protein
MKKLCIVLCIILIFIAINCGRRKNPLEPEFVTLVSPERDEIVTLTRPTFTWNAVSYGFLYQIQIDNRNTFYTPVIDDSLISSALYVCPISLSDQEYWWRVRVRQEHSSWEVWSEINKFTMAVGTPIPLSPVNDTVTTNMPSFTWNAIPFAQKYRIQIDDNNTFVTVVADDSSITGESFVPDTAFSDGLYYWRVRVKTEDEEWGKWSTVAEFFMDTNPFRIVASYQTMGYARGVLVRRDTAYVAQGEGGFAIIDLTDEENPVLVGESSAHGNALTVAIRDTFAYLAAGKDGVSTIGFADPHAPEWQSLAAGGDDNAVDLVIVSPPTDTMSYIFVAERDEGMWVLEILPGYPGFPQPFFPFNVPGYENGLFLDSVYLFIACGELGLTILDISKVTEPEIIGTCDTKGYATKLFVRDTLVYIADGREGLKIANISDISAPYIIGSFDTEDDAKDIFVKGDTVFIADENNGLVVVDVSDPILPQYLGGVLTENAESVWVEDDYAVIVDRYEGILIVKW